MTRKAWMVYAERKAQTARGLRTLRTFWTGADWGREMDAVAFDSYAAARMFAQIEAQSGVVTVGVVAVNIATELVSFEIVR